MADDLKAVPSQPSPTPTPSGASPTPTKASVAGAFFVVPDLDAQSVKKKPFMTGLQLKKIIKGTIAYVLAFMFIFWDKTNTWVQARTFGNIVLAVIVSEPAGTVGTFFDLLFVSSGGLGLAGLCWCLLNLIAGGDYTLNCVVLFVFSYMFSWIRSLGPRFFGVGLIGPLMCFTAVASNVYQVAGISTANGSTFDQPYLRDTMYAFMIGIAICAIINLCFFPDFAEAHCRTHLVNTIRNTRTLITLLVKTYSTETDPSDTARRDRLVATIKAEMRQVRVFLTQADGELFRGKFTAVELRACLEVLLNLVGDLLSVNTAIVGHEVEVFQSRVYQERFAQRFNEELKSVQRSCNDLLDRVACALEGSPRRDDIESGSFVRGQLSEILKGLEDAQRGVMMSFFRGEERIEMMKGSADKLLKGSVAVESLTQFNFFIQGFAQAVSEIDNLVTGLVERPHRYRFHFNIRHYIPAREPRLPKSENAPKRPPLEVLSRFLLSTESIYAIKCSIAILIYQLVLFNQQTFYKTYFLQSSFLTFVVAVAPNIGQSSMGFIINMLGAALGYSWGFFALSMWGTGTDLINGVCYGWFGCGSSTISWLPQFGLGLMAFVWSIPMFHLLANTKMSVLGLLSLLSYSTMVIGSWGNRNNPRYDAPWNRYYKLLASASMAITFGLVFTIAVFPNLARSTLRSKLSHILRRLNDHYNNTLLVGYTKPPQSQDPHLKPNPSILQLRAVQNSIARELDSLEELMVFSHVEFRTAGAFQTDVYRGILTHTSNILDRLAAARVAMGDNPPFDDSVTRMLTTTFRGARQDLQAAVRGLLYVFSTALIAKQPLPGDMPQATRARNVIFRAFWRVSEAIAQDEMRAAGHAESEALEERWRKQEEDYERREGGEEEVRQVFEIVSDVAALREAKEAMNGEHWLKYYAFAMAMRMLSVDIDALTPLFKKLFGELPSGFNFPEKTPMTLTPWKIDTVERMESEKSISAERINESGLEAVVVEVREKDEIAVEKDSAFITAVSSN
ncbi:hypothetical protein HK101_006641 [Irineochytrium annulatum]|nr:hypothetical protein HK101_006641 [Irineochytrium annulatum]